MNKRLLFTISSVTLLIVEPAFAQPNYPEVVKDYLGAVRKPACKVCHEDGITGLGTVTTRFGINMLSYTLQAYDEGSVRRALDAMRAFNKISSDRKSPTDIEVLKAGGDPNDTVPVYIVADPEYGCGGASFVGRRRAHWPGWIAVVLALALARRRRRHS